MDEEWKDNFLSSLLSSGKAIPKNMFEKLTAKEKRYYVNRHLVRTAYFEEYEIPYLSSTHQKKMIDQLVNKGEALMKHQIDALTKDNQKYYKKAVKKRLNEQKLRKIIRTILQ